MSLQDISPLELARQIALFDHRLLRAIKITELMHKKWEKNRSEAANLIAFGQRMEDVRILLESNIREAHVLGGHRDRAYSQPEASHFGSMFLPEPSGTAAGGPRLPGSDVCLPSTVAERN